MLILSLDPATKTLGIIFVRYNENWEEDLEKCETMEEIRKTLDNFEILYLNSAFITEPKNPFGDRMKALKLFINNFNKTVLKPAIKKYNESLKVLVEQQRPDNPISVPVMHCLLYEYSIYDSCLVGAAIKNTVELDPNNTYGDFVKKYSAVYTANKRHSINNLEYYLKTFNKEHLLKGFKKKDDIADAFMQMVGWLNRQ